jgi:hypothetical protein
MSIKPAMGWLALLLFTTTAQAEGTRDLMKGTPKTSKSMTAALSSPVTPKTKATPVALVNAASHGLSLVENTSKPRTDYEADVYAGVPLDAAIAKERGVDKGLVTMVFERQRRPAFRIARDKIHRVVRLAAEDRAIVSVMRSQAGSSARSKDHIDVLDTEDGVVVVDTSAQGVGMFVTSDVYTFAKGATLDRRIAALEVLAAPTRDRLREALVAAEWAPTPKPDVDTKR